MLLAPVLGCRDQPRDRARIPPLRSLQLGLSHVSANRPVAPPQQVVDHPLQAHRAAIVGRVHVLDAVRLQVGDLLRQDHTAAAGEYPDLLPARLLQPVVHVLQVLDVTALIRGHGDRVCVFLNRTVHDLVHRPVMTQMDDFGAARLQDPPHDVDRCVVPVEQRRRRDDPDLVPPGVRLRPACVGRSDRAGVTPGRGDGGGLCHGSTSPQGSLSIKLHGNSGYAGQRHRYRPRSQSVTRARQ
jgi:hypothetical protein